MGQFKFRNNVPIITEVDLSLDRTIQDIYSYDIIGFEGDVKFTNPIDQEEQHISGQFSLFEGYFDEEYQKADRENQINYRFQQKHLIFIVDYRPALLAIGVKTL